MFTIYADKDAFEYLVMYKENVPHWNQILCNHSQVCLNITEDDLVAEESSDTPIFLFTQAYGGRSPLALKSHFDALYEDQSIMAETPRAAYFLNVTKEVAKDWQDQFGIIVQSAEMIDDNLLKGTSHRELLKDSVVQSGKSIGWRELVNFGLPPSNAMVITDDWLLKNEESGKLVGELNTVLAIDALLPIKVNTPYHILIITDDQGRTKERCEKLAGDIIAQIRALRHFEINVELVFTDTIHKRKIFMNYLSITCDKGFAMFRIADQKTVRDDNDFRYEKMFNRVQQAEGDTVFTSDSILLKQLQDKCKTVTEYLKNRQQDANRRILGGCNPNKSVRNRLLNDV